MTDCLIATITELKHHTIGLKQCLNKKSVNQIKTFIKMLKQQLKTIITKIKATQYTTIEKAANTEAAQTIQTAVTQYWIEKEIYTPSEITQRFEIPPQLLLYLREYSAISQNKGWRSLFAYDHIIADTNYWYKYFLSDKKYLKPAEQNPTIVLAIGGWSDKHWYFISCDKERHFGKVYEAYDTDFYKFPTVAEEEWEDFFTFLEKEF